MIRKGLGCWKSVITRLDASQIPQTSSTPYPMSNPNDTSSRTISQELIGLLTSDSDISSPATRILLRSMGRILQEVMRMEIRTYDRLDHVSHHVSWWDIF